MIGLFLLSSLFGCALEYYPKGRWMYYPRELPAADRAVEAARQAGKDKECPDEFNAAEKMKNDAWETYWACHTDEGIAMAKDAAAKANALCPVKAAPAPPPPPPPAPPTVSLSANPATIQQGQCSNLTWTSANASQASLDQGIGSVDLGGSRQVCPGSNTQYTITAAGPGGSRTASTTVSVTPPPPPPPKVIDRLTIHVNFDFDKAVIRPADQAELQKAVDFVKKYPGYKISLEGHTDSIGTEKYNQGLSERRAAAVKDYLLKEGVADGQRIQTAGYGESRPIADNKTDKGRFENRRVEVLILSE
jgi:OOP family OmpA-OmpF porin